MIYQNDVLLLDFVSSKHRDDLKVDKSYQSRNEVINYKRKLKTKLK